MSFYDDASLVLIPSGYKAGKVYSQKPLSTDGELTFTRASHATRVNVAGNVEKARTNNLLQSNTFSGAVWVKTNAPTVTSGQAGYDGTTDAWKLEASTTGISRSIHQINNTTGVVSFSVYLKKGTTDWCRLNLSGIGNRYFNLNTGAAGTGGLNYNIESAANGYYRITVWGNGTSTGPYIFLAAADNDLAVTAGDNIYIQDAQLEKGLVATDYIETTTAAVTVGIYNDVPRLDYSGGASCPALLLEPQRTNQVTYSEYFDASYWSKTNSTIINNAVLSPEGLQNATELFDNATSGAHFVYKSAISASSNHIISFFAKANTLSQVFVNGGASLYAYVDLINGVKLSGTADTTIEDYGNGWWRISIISDRDGILIATSKNTNNNYSGSGESIYLYGVQSEEAASYATSYIPTYGSSVTRSADNALATHTIADTETLTFFTEFIAPERQSGGGEHLLENSSGSSRIRVYQNTSDSLRIRTDVPAVNFDYSYSSLGISVGDRVKVCLRVDNGVMTAFINGVEKNTFGAATINFAKMHLRPQSIMNVDSTIIFPTALTDSECIALTTL